MVVHLEIIDHRSRGLQGILLPSVRFLIMSTLNLELLAKKGGREKRKEGGREEEREEGREERGVRRRRERLNIVILAQNYKDFVNSVLNFYSVSQS